MADPVDELIKEIAAKHGVAMDRDDPILILHTMNARLTEENAIAQQAMIERFKQEFEALSSRWNGDATERAERVLNATLGASKNLMREGANDAATSIRNEIDRALAEYSASLRAARQVSILNIVASLITLVAVAIAVWAVMHGKL